MKIDNANIPKANTPPNAARTQQAAKAPAEQAQAAALKPETVAVQLSAMATQLKTDAQAPVDKAKVQEIKQAIAEGRFSINPEAIADRLIDSARELLAGQRRNN